MYTLQLIKTEDGSQTLRVEELNETYHSVHGAVTESKYVFIRHGFRHFLSLYNPQKVNILEIGLGTGLNVFLTLLENRKFRREIHYQAIEPFPLPSPILENLNYTGQFEGLDLKTDFDNIHQDIWDSEYSLDEQFFFQKSNVKAEEFRFSPHWADVVFYDAFSPGKQPNLWTLEMLKKVEVGLADHGIIVTYTAKGQVKRDLKTLGLQVETLQGPPGKKEMIRAWKSLSPPGQYET